MVARRLCAESFWRRHRIGGEGMKKVQHIIEMITKPISREIGIKIRQKLNPSKICDWCLSDHKHQTKRGSRLCGECYEDYMYVVEMDAMKERKYKRE
jgi:protein-arginine kinase activator protein McsA